MPTASNRRHPVQQVPFNELEHSKNGLASCGAFAFFPNAIARDPRVPPSLLVLLAFRLTIADQKSDFGLNEKALSNRPIVKKGTGLGKNNIRAALALAQRPELAYLRRWQKPPKAGTFGNAVDRLSLPPCGASGEEGRQVRKQWFDGTLSLDAMAVFLFIRAGSGNGPSIFASEVAERFDWSRPTVGRYLSELERHNLIKLDWVRHPDGNGRFFGKLYRELSEDRWSIWRRVKKPGGLRTNPPHAEKISSRVYASQIREAVHARDIDFGPLTTAENSTEPSDIAWDSHNLLASLEQGMALSPRLWDVEEETIQAISEVMNDEALRRALQCATDGRISSEILSDAGLYAVRWLSALRLTAALDALGEEIEPTDALQFILRAIFDRIGSRPPSRLNSLSIIGKRIVGDGYDYCAEQLYTRR